MLDFLFFVLTEMLNRKIVSEDWKVILDLVQLYFKKYTCCLPPYWLSILNDSLVAMVTCFISHFYIYLIKVPS